MRPGPAKIVLVAPNWLGDAAMSLPAVGALGRAGVTVSVMSRPYTARVYRGVEGVDELVVPGGDGRAGRIRRQARALQSLGATAVVLCPPSFSSALAAWSARTPVRVGYEGDGRAWMLTDALATPPRGSEHLSLSYVRLAGRALERLGASPHDAAPAPAVEVFEEDRREASRLIAGLGITGDYAVVVPGAAYGPAKSWPVNRFQALVQVLSRDIPVLVASGPAERDLCARVADGAPGARSVAGATSLGGFFALAAGARAVIANDSGTPHIAAALGVPTVVLFGSTSPEWTRPLGDHVEVLRHRVHCSPCFRRTCPTALECFAGISVEDTLAAARRALALNPAPKKGVAQTQRGH